MKTLITALTVTLMPLTAFAADPLPAQVQRLERLVGNWKGSGTLAMGKDTARINVTLSCKRTSAKFGVLCNFRVTGVPGMAAYEETDLFGYEPNSDTVHWFAVTNAGETHDHVAKPPSGDRYDFTFTGTQEGKALKETIALEFAKDGKSTTARSETTLGGEPAGTLDITLRK